MMRDRGAAVIEFLLLGVGLLIPLAYIGIAAAGVQSAVFASTQAVREAGRAFASSVTADEGRGRALAAARLAFADHGLDLPAGALHLTCPEGACLSPGSSVVVDLSWSVSLPGVPAAIPVQSTHTVPIDDFRGSPA
jgi:hypothetical protein